MSPFEVCSKCAINLSTQSQLACLVYLHICTQYTTGYRFGFDELKDIETGAIIRKLERSGYILTTEQNSNVIAIPNGIYVTTLPDTLDEIYLFCRCGKK